MRCFGFLILSPLLLVGCYSGEPEAMSNGDGSSSSAEVVVALTPAEQFEKLNDDYAVAVRNDANDVSIYPQKFLNLAKEHPKDRIAFGALNWVIVMSKDPQQKAEAVDQLLDKHIDQSAIAQICEVIQRQPFSERSKDQLTTIMEKSPHESVRGMAAFALASHMATAPAGDRKEQEIRDIYEMVIEQYGANPQIVGRAKMALAKMKFAIGKIAPDISGSDLDGVAFKLSDYRGKVVVLDFWGDW